MRAGTIKSIDLDQQTLHAVVTVHVTQPGFGAFHSDAFCQSRPQSLIGEYFVECQPGNAGKVLTAGSTIPVTHTQTTIPADLLQDVMRMPYRERFTLIINELGAAVAGRSSDLQAALRRAVPALTQTDNLLRLLGNDSQTLQALTANSDAVITALANNSAQVRRFIDEADKAATDTATQQSNLQASLHKLPGFLEQLRPALQKLGAATDANLPVVSNLNAASGQLNRLFTDLPAFSRSALPALRSLGQASVTGKTAVQAANPTITHLNQFAQSTPELSGNLAIVLHDLDDRSRAVEPDPRSPNGQGYTGLEAVLQYVFNQTLAINTFGPFGHQLTVDAFVSAMCTPYATPGTIAQNLQTFGSRYRSCYSWLGPNQPGVNETDPSAPGAKVPDPGGAPPGETGPQTSAGRLTVASAASKRKPRRGTQRRGLGQAGRQPDCRCRPRGTWRIGRRWTGWIRWIGWLWRCGRCAVRRRRRARAAPRPAPGPVTGVQQTLGQILGALGVGSSSGSSGSAGGSSSSPSSTPSQPSGNQTQQLLSYLLSP